MGSLSGLKRSTFSTVKMGSTVAHAHVAAPSPSHSRSAAAPRGGGVEGGAARVDTADPLWAEHLSAGHPASCALLWRIFGRCCRNFSPKSILGALDEIFVEKACCAAAAESPRQRSPVKQRPGFAGTGGAGGSVFSNSGAFSSRGVAGGASVVSTQAALSPTELLENTAFGSLPLHALLALLLIQSARRWRADADGHIAAKTLFLWCGKRLTTSSAFADIGDARIVVTSAAAALDADLRKKLFFALGVLWHGSPGVGVNNGKRAKNFQLSKSEVVALGELFSVGKLFE